MQDHQRADHALSAYFRAKQFAMGQRYVREAIVTDLARRGLRTDEVEKIVVDWEVKGLIRHHSDRTISLTPAAYPKLTQ